ncbi:MAG: hypothetical protein QOI15_666 [Pseudonocardiales bacterium]|nr:hypothetical protein [Pseudonocardiales bacterium]
MAIRADLGKSRAGLAAATLVAASTIGTVAVATSYSAAADPPQCQLGNGVQHVISLVFDNVHFFRDNPNVPSDLEQMPHLLNFLQSNGTVFSNTHTPLIAHTADDSLSIYTGLYGDRHGQPLTNTYKTYNPDGSTDPATSFAYWTSPVVDTKSPPSAGHDTTPTLTYSDTSPASGPPNRITPAPWVPFTRAGCSVGDFSTANMVLENTRLDLNTVFGAGSPEVAQLNADPDSFKDPEVADYIGVAVHCAHGDAICADAQAVKFGQSSASPTASPDLLPTEPGGYNGYQALFGARYVAPQLGAGTPNLTRNGYQITDAAGNLVDENGTEIQEPFSHRPGFPGFSPTATQSLAYLADMQESGIPVTYGYISDTHDKKAGATGCTSPGNALGAGDACYVAALHSYDQAFQTFFERLATDGITPANTEFVISAEENDQMAGANVGRVTQPSPPGCDGVTVACHYATGQMGELAANIKGLLSTTASSGTQYDVEPQGAAIYVHGQPGATDPTVRQLERDTAAMTSNLTYSGVPNEHIVKYQAGALEQRVLHLQTNDPLRTPTYTLFPMPDYFFTTSGANVSVNPAFGWNHGYYSPNIDITWAGIVGPGVAVRGVDGPGPSGGNESHDPNSTNTVPQASAHGTWIEETDLRPTLLHLVALTDDYASDGQVISQALTHPNGALAKVTELATLYRQLNSSVGAFATNTLIADSKALASGSAADDTRYADEQKALALLAAHRDRVVTLMKATLARAAVGRAPGHGELQSQLAQGRALLKQSAQLVAQS